MFPTKESVLVFKNELNGYAGIVAKECQKRPSRKMPTLYQIVLAIYFSSLMMNAMSATLTLGLGLNRNS
jgi:hypothetical protein